MPTTATTTFCKDLPSCFQAIYNLLFALLIALAFLYFLYGAFLYLLSAGGWYDQAEAKKRMINSIVALLIALGMPMILYMINPEMFKVTLQVPEVTTVEVKRLFEIVDFAEALNGAYGNYQQLDLSEQRELGVVIALPEAQFVDVPNASPPVKNITQTAYYYAKNPNQYRPIVGGDPTACNFFVWTVLEETGVVRRGVCVPAHQIDNVLENKVSVLTINGKKVYYRWKRIPYDPTKIIVGDVLVREIPPGKQHGHTAIVVPIQNKKDPNKTGLALAHASLGRNRPRITPVSGKFHWIMRMVPISEEEAKKLTRIN
jgi:hypothetical protein